MRFYMPTEQGPSIPNAMPPLPIRWATTVCRPKASEWTIHVAESIAYCMMRGDKLASFDTLAAYTRYGYNDLMQLLEKASIDDLAVIEAWVPGMLREVGLGAYKRVAHEGSVLRNQIYEVAYKAAKIMAKDGGKSGVGLENCIVDQNGSYVSMEATLEEALGGMETKDDSGDWHKAFPVDEP